MDTIRTPEKFVKHDIVHNIITNNETLLSGLAWKGFLTNGRGYLFFHKTLEVNHIAGNNFEYKFDKAEVKGIIYFAKDSEIYNNARKSENMTGQSKEWVDFYKKVDTYHPRNEFLIIVGLNKDEIATEHSFLIVAQTPPYKAFHDIRRRQSEFNIELTL